MFNLFSSALGRMRFRTKLAVLLVAPLVAAVFFASSGIVDNAGTASDLGKMNQLSGLAVNISSLIHETQKERGNTGLFIGAEGEEFGDNLASQRDLTDGQISGLDTFLASFDASGFGSEFERELAQLNSKLAGVPSHRSDVSSLSVTLGEGLAYYTDLNSTALSLVGTIVGLSPNAELSALTAAYLNFLQGKERAGIERAVLSSAFARGQFSEGQFAQFNSLVTAQDTYLSVFESFATDEMIEEFDSKLTSSIMSRVDEFRTIAVANASNDNFGGTSADEWFSAATARINALKAMDDVLAATLIDTTAGMRSDAQVALWRTVIIGLIALSISIAASWFITVQITGQVGNMAASLKVMAEKTLPSLVRITRDVAAGDLTNRADVNIEQLDITATDEVGVMAAAYNSVGDQVGQVGHAVNEMVDKLAALIGETREIAESVASTSSELSSSADQAGDAVQGIAEAAQQVATGAQEQATVVQRASVNVDESSESVERIATGSREQSEAVEEAQAIVKEVATASKNVTSSAEAASIESEKADSAANNGLQAVELTVAGMERISTAVQSVTAQVSDLGTKSNEIGNIVSVIDDIAAQTNLLALNAAIEAARAGEQGRGFAVVADEVRQLAERVTAATSEIASLIEGVQGSVESSIKATEEGSKEVTEGAELAKRSGETLQEIIGAVQSVNEQITSITNAAGEVSNSSEKMVETIDRVSSIAGENTEAATEVSQKSQQVREAVDTIASIAEETAASAEESSASTEEMSAQVEEVVASASELAGMAATLQTSVSVFRLSNAEAKRETKDESVADGFEGEQAA